MSPEPLLGSWFKVQRSKVQGSVVRGLKKQKSSDAGKLGGQKALELESFGAFKHPSFPAFKPMN
jgi:hypothetical protein